MENDLQKSIDVVVKALKEDKDFYMAWQANIAMAMLDQICSDYDGAEGESYRLLHETANKGAKRFLDLFCM